MFRRIIALPVLVIIVIVCFSHAFLLWIWHGRDFADKNMLFEKLMGKIIKWGE